MIDRPTVPLSQRVFGEIVYWVTVACAILCILGPVVAFTDMDKNVINPHYLMENIFDGMAPDFEEQELQSMASAGQNVFTVEDADKFSDPEDVDREIKIRISDANSSEELILESIDTDTDTITLATALSNSYSLDEEAEVAEVTIWEGAKDDVKGGHFWMDHITTGDGLTQFGLALGCGVGFFAMIAAGLIFIIREKSFGWALGSFWIAFMIAVSATGVIALH